MAHDFKEIMKDRDWGGSVWRCWKCGTPMMVINGEKIYFPMGTEADLPNGTPEEPECIEE